MSEMLKLTDEELGRLVRTQTNYCLHHLEEKRREKAYPASIGFYAVLQVSDGYRQFSVVLGTVGP